MPKYDAKSQLDAMCMPESKEAGYVWNATLGTLSKCIDDVWTPADDFRIIKVQSHGWYDDNGNVTKKGGTSRTVFLISFAADNYEDYQSTATFKGMSSAAIQKEIKNCIEIAAKNDKLFTDTFINVKAVKVKTAQGTHYEPVIIDGNSK